MTGRDDRLLRRGSLAVAALATTILVGGVVLGTESAIAAPLKLTVKSRTYAIDGTDVYWLRSVMQSRYESDDLLTRTRSACAADWSCARTISRARASRA